MTRRKKRNHSKHQPSPIMIAAPAAAQLQSKNPSTHTELKQGLLSYFSAGKSFVAASFGYLTMLSQILPTSAQNLKTCVLNEYFPVWVQDSCYEFFKTGVTKVNGTSTFCEVDPKTIMLFEQLGQKIYDENACGYTGDCSILYPEFITIVNNISIYGSWDQPLHTNYINCAKDLINNLSQGNHDESTNTWAIIAYVALAIVGASAAGVGLYYAKKFINSWLQQREQAQGATEETSLFNQF